MTTPEQPPTSSLAVSLLTGRRVLISGGAGRIGAATALAVARAGGIPLVADVDPAGLERVGECLAAWPHHRILADLRGAAGIEACQKAALAAAGGIEAAVHAAYPCSTGWGASFEELNEAHLAVDLQAQLGGAILFSQSLLRHFSACGGGDLIHVASIQGVAAPKFHHYAGTAMGSSVEYAAIKAGVIAISRWLAKYHRDQGIRVNCVSPGGILDQQPASFLERYRADCTNIGMLEGADVAATIVFLLSEGARAINGQNLIVDDGWTL
jgi:NAD(P)-dependent dehydrogenase (short-subunit alcohol dehydrogenase family)